MEANKNYSFESLRDYFDRMLNSFYFAYRNFYDYKILLSVEDNPLIERSPHFINEYMFASHFCTVVVIKNLLDKKSQKYETMTLDWLFDNMKLLREFDKEKINKWIKTKSSLSVITINKIDALRHKLYAHMDVDFFSYETDKYLMDCSEFEKILEPLKTIMYEIYESFYGQQPVFSDFGEYDIKKIIEVCDEYPSLKDIKRKYELLILEKNHP